MRNHESLGKSILYTDQYFSALSSVRVWAEVKVWLKGKNSGLVGIGATIRTSMSWPQVDSGSNNAMSTVYQTPMPLIHGPGIPISPNTPPTLYIDVDELRLRILEVLQ